MVPMMPAIEPSARRTAALLMITSHSAPSAPLMLVSTRST